MLDKINDLQDKLNQNLPLLNNDLGSVQKKSPLSAKSRTTATNRRK